jgi:hypothetical protein
VRKESRTTMGEFAELGHSFNKMGVDEISDPVSQLGIKR